MSSCTDARARRLRRARRRARGAVVLEAVIVVAFLVMMFFLLVGLLGLYRAKLLVLQDSRYKNTLNATNSCRVDGPSALPPFAFEPLAGLDLPDDPLPFFSDFQMVGTPFGVGGVSRTHVEGYYAFQTRRDRNDPSIPPRGLSGHVYAQSLSACNPYAISLDPLELLKQVGLKDALLDAMHDALGGADGAP